MREVTLKDGTAAQWREGSKDRDEYNCRLDADWLLCAGNRVIEMIVEAENGVHFGPVGWKICFQEYDETLYPTALAAMQAVEARLGATPAEPEKV